MTTGSSSFDLGAYFDVFLSSCYLGLRKPDPKIFELALDVLQRDAEEVAFIDDRQAELRCRRGSGNSCNPLSG